MTRILRVIYRGDLIWCACCDFIPTLLLVIIYNRHMTKSIPNEKAYWSSDVFPAWSATLTFPENRIAYEKFRQNVNCTAQTERHRYTGLITLDPATNQVTSFTRTLYPRKKYPVPQVDECAIGMTKLGEAFGVLVEPDNMPTNTYRAPLGLYVGQQDTYERAPDHTIDSVQDMLATKGLGSIVTAANVFTVRFGESGVENYTEPVAVTTGPLAEIDDICDLAVELGQERFTLERFPLGSPPTVQMIETIHCQEPEWR